GYSRPTFSPAWREACDYVIAEAKRAGARWRFDAAGNVRIRHGSVPWERPVWLVGSHLDSVPSGGKYDGVIGVVVPLEIMRVCPGAPLELIVFTEEEGTTFGVGMLGSRALSGRSDAATLAALSNGAGQGYFDAGAGRGVDPAGIARLPEELSGYLGMIEVHAEQGPGLWNAGKPLAVVGAISGRRQFSIYVDGHENHAGATAMADRTDALAAAADVVLGVERLGNELTARASHTVMTVGRLDVHPNAANVIPGRVQLTVDFRARTGSTLDSGRRMLEEELEQVTGRRGVRCRLDLTEAVDPVALDSAVVERLGRAAAGIGVELPEVNSGALHDAAIMSSVLPTAMIFVASKDGISHSPSEFSRSEDIAAAARVVAGAIRA
ncbi:MAG: Zn-dependent hydrolase, partial [Spirochaetales bacterium]